MISPVMPQSSLGINRSAPKDFSGLSTPPEVGRWPLLLPQTQVQQMERVQQVLQNETPWVLIHGDVALQSKIIPAPGCSVPISACSCSMALLPSALMEQHIPTIPLPGALSVLGSVSPTSRHVPLCSHPAAGRVLLEASWTEPGGPMPGTCWAGSGSVLLLERHVGSQQHPG